MSQTTLDFFIQVDTKAKKCSICGELKTLDNFCKNKNTKDGLNQRCRACTREYEILHKDEISARRKVERSEKREEKLARSREYYQKNKEAICKRTAEYKIKNKELVKKRTREYTIRTTEKRIQYHIDNADRIKAWQREYCVTHAEEISIRRKKRYRENKEKIALRNKIYCQSEKGKLRDVRKKAKRRELGYNPINTRFEGSHYHHLRYDSNGNVDTDLGIYIPAELHTSVNHDGFTGRGMEEINKIAIEWYLSTCNSNHEELLKLGFNSVEEFVERYKPSN